MIIIIIIIIIIYFVIIGRLCTGDRYYKSGTTMMYLLAYDKLQIQCHKNFKNTNDIK
jgi:hypothetical protein